MTTSAGFLTGLTEPQRGQLLALAETVRFPSGARIFDEGELAERFWIVEEGSVALDVHVPGQSPPIVETLGPGDLVGWSWLFPPYRWHLGARTLSPVTARQFDAAAVRDRCARDPDFGHALTCAVGSVIGRRLRGARARLLDLYGPPRGGGR